MCFSLLIGPSLPIVPELGLLKIPSTTVVTIQWTIPEVIYAAEHYNVYYALNSSGCASSDEGYNKSATVYGLNHTDFFSIRNQQYNVTLDNLLPYNYYCYKVVSRNSAGRTDSAVGIFITQLQSGEYTSGFDV